MEQNLWLAAHHFSFWYWKLGGTVKKTPCIFIHTYCQRSIIFAFTRFFSLNLQFWYKSCIVIGQMNQMPTKMHRDCMEAGWLIYVRRSQLLEGLPQSLGRNVLDHIDDMCYFWFKIWYSNTWVVQLIGIIYLWAKLGNFCTLFELELLQTENTNHSYFSSMLV